MGQPVPEISRFFGIVIQMYIDDHAPPHFHARYNDYIVSVEIETLVATGKVPPRTLRMILEWAELHQKELIENWYLLRDKKQPNKIEPLE